LIGQTARRRGGRSFDKIAKLLGLGFPGGPVVQRVAEKGKRGAIAFPRADARSRRFRSSVSPVSRPQCASMSTRDTA
jgi:N6-L-threonylcarbamoyladenine synthase